MRRSIRKIVLFLLMIVMGCLCESEVYAANYSFTTATPIALNQSVTDHLVDGTIGNFYRFRTDSDGVVCIKFSHAELEYDHKEWIVELYDANREYLMETIIWGADANTWSCNYGLPSGEYYIKVLPYNSLECREDNYQLTVIYNVTNNWETENNDGFTIADNIACNKAYYGNIAIGSDWDYYNVTLPKNGYIKVNFNHQYLEAQYNLWTITLYDSNRNVIEEIYSAGYENKKSVSLGYLAKGNYYLKVTAYNTLSYGFEQADYCFKLAYTTPKASILSANSTSAKKMTVKWKKLKGISGYEIVTATDKKFKKNKKVTNVSSSNKKKAIIKKLKKNKKYYVKMRGYITVDGQKCYGPYSKIKNVKVR